MAVIGTNEKTLSVPHVGFPFPFNPVKALLKTVSIPEVACVYSYLNLSPFGVVELIKYLLELFTILIPVYLIPVSVNSTYSGILPPSS